MKTTLAKFTAYLAMLSLCGCANAYDSDSSRSARPITDADIQAVEDGKLTLDELFGSGSTIQPGYKSQRQGVGNNADPVIGTPQRQAPSNADFVAPKPEPKRYASFGEMAADPEIRRLFKQWLGPGDRYVDNGGKFRTDLTGTRRNSYAGLARRKWVNCQIGKTGMSGFVRYGQAKDTGTSGRIMVDSRGGAWPSAQDTTPQQQAKFESYCELFNQLAPHFIEQGELEH